VDASPEVFRLAARIAAPDGGVVHPVLLRRESDPAHDAAAVSALEAVANAQGVDGAGAVVVDRSLAAGVAHAAAAHLATLVVADGPMWSERAGVAPPAPVLEFRGPHGALLHAAPAPGLAAELGRRAAGVQVSADRGTWR
jgi:hypothetical protein